MDNLNRIQLFIPALDGFNKVRMIKLLRMFLGCGLKEAKDFIDDYYEGVNDALHHSSTYYDNESGYRMVIVCNDTAAARILRLSFSTSTKERTRFSIMSAKREAYDAITYF